MANKFDDQLARMKSLMTYGRVNEDKAPINNYSIEYRAKAADGKTYGIIRECNKYYIKCAPDGKETIAEAYKYLGGWANKTDYEYENYPKAYKQFELKLASINEAHEAEVNYSDISPFIKQDLMTEASKNMKNEIARQRQIMYNASMIMNESKDYAVKGGEACNTKQPEAETGKKGDEGYKETKANPKSEGTKTNGVDKKAEPFDENPSKTKDQLKEELDTDFDEGMGKGRDPKSIGWDMDNQTKVNEGETCPECGKEECTCNEENEKEWASKGLPGTPGVGEADTDHNNDPFTKNVNEEVEDDSETVTDVDDDEDISLDDTEDELDGEEDFEEFPEDSDTETFEDDIEISDDGDEVEDEEEFSEEGVDESDPEAIRAEIDRLQSLLDGMESGEEDFDTGDETDFDDGIEDEYSDDEFDSEDEFGDEDFEGEVDELNGSDYLDTDFEDGNDNGFDVSDDADTFGEEDDLMPVDDDMDECGGFNPMMEAKQRKMNAIVESVVKKIIGESKKKRKINEDELHDFGKHPGYRKKPMQLPPTGEDQNQWGRDWNDESTHTDEPFGKQIGNGDPFNQLVAAVTKDVMYQLKKGVPIEGESKKKAE